MLFLSPQIDRLDVDSLFSNIESVHQVSATLLSLLEEATTDVEPAVQVIGMFVLFSSSTVEQEIRFLLSPSALIFFFYSTGFPGDA